jgi:hypothetical protein
MRLIFVFLFTGAMISSRAQVADSVRAMGKSAFMQACEGCHHDTINARIPARIILSTMTLSGSCGDGNQKNAHPGFRIKSGSEKAIAEWIKGVP